MNDIFFSKIMIMVTKLMLTIMIIIMVMVITVGKLPSDNSKNDVVVVIKSNSS